MKRENSTCFHKVETLNRQVVEAIGAEVLEIRDGKIREIRDYHRYFPAKAA